MVKGAGLRLPWRRPAWVQIPPPAPIKIESTMTLYEQKLRIIK